MIVGSGIRDVAAHLLHQLQELAPVGLREVLDIGPVEVQVHVRLPLGEELHRLEQRLSSLEGRELSEEAEPVARSLLLGSVRLNVAGRPSSSNLIRSAGIPQSM